MAWRVLATSRGTACSNSLSELGSKACRRSNAAVAGARSAGSPHGCAAAGSGRQSPQGLAPRQGAPAQAERRRWDRVAFEQRFHVEALTLLYAYWQEVRGRRRAPTRAEIDPSRIRPVLPNIALFDVEETPRRYRIRLMGTRNVSWYGADPSGCYLDELDIGDGRADLFALLDQIVARGVPGHMTGQYTKQDGRTLRYERLFMPLSNDARRIDMLIGAVCRLPPDAPIIGDSLDLPEPARQPAD